MKFETVLFAAAFLALALISWPQADREMGDSEMADIDAVAEPAREDRSKPAPKPARTEAAEPDERPDRSGPALAAAAVASSRR